jgi:paraquat-inducible protein A
LTITCGDCGRTQTIPQLPIGATAECVRCDRLLGRRTGGGFDAPLACAIAVFLLLPPAAFLPLFESTIRNLFFEESRLISSVPVIYSEVWFPLAFGFFFFAILFPAVRALLQIVVLSSLKFGWHVWQRGRIFRWSEELRVWSMPEVVVIAGAVAYFRASVPADVLMRAGGACYLGVAIASVLGNRMLDRRLVWNAIFPDAERDPGRDLPSCDGCELAVLSRRTGDPCPRCGEKLDQNVTQRFTPALAALAAALPLTIPAYGAAVMVNDQLTGVLEHTVIGTVQLLADSGAWHFGVVVLIAGVGIPLAELAGMLWLLFRTRFPEKNGLVLRTRVYRVMHHMIRWPMILPFIAAIAAPIVDYRGIDDIASGPGATPLFMLIALTMFAVRIFEPRLMWKTAGEAR